MTKIKNKFRKIPRRNNYDNLGGLSCSCNKSCIGNTNRNFKIRYKEQRKLETNEKNERVIDNNRSTTKLLLWEKT